MDGFHHHQRAHAPQQAELKADVAPDVEREVAVVPPTGVVNFFQCPAAHKFQRAGQDDAADVQRQNAVLQRREGKQHDDHAEAVDGAHRPVEKTAVHQLAGGCGSIDDLKAPPQTGVDEEKRKDMVQRKPAYHGIGQKGKQKNTSK